MSEITFSGLSSGMDTAGMLEKLMEIERRPIQLLERKQTDILQKQGAFERLDGTVTVSYTHLTLPTILLV